MQGVLAAVRRWFDDTCHFFTTKVWHARLDALPRWRAARYRTSRIAYSTFQELVFGDALHVRAAALTYFTVLSVVPLLAFVFAILKGFGAYDALIEQTVRPYVFDTFAGSPSLQHAFEQILVFVSGTGVTSLGFLGLVTLLYTATRLLRNVEIALNDIWKVPVNRQPLRQLTDYAAIIVVIPVCLLLAGGLGTVTQLLGSLRGVADQVGMAGALDWTVGIVSPLLVISLGFFVLYQIMPNTRVSFRSSAIGAVVGGLLWYAALVAHVHFQVGVAKFNALYSSFAVIPIFLVWLYVSWLAVLTGAQAAASHQHAPQRAQQLRAAPVDQRDREAVALSALLRISDAFLRAASHPTRDALRDALDVPEELIDEALESLVSAALVVRTDAAVPGFIPSRAPAELHVMDVINALRGPRLDAGTRTSQPGDRLAIEALHTLDDELTHSGHNLSISELLRDRHDIVESGHHRARGTG